MDDETKGDGAQRKDDSARRSSKPLETTFLTGDLSPLGLMAVLSQKKMTPSVICPAAKEEMPIISWSGLFRMKAKGILEVSVIVTERWVWMHV